MLQVRHWKGRQTFLGEFLAGCESADSQLDQWWILEARLPQVQSLPLVGALYATVLQQA